MKVKIKKENNMSKFKVGDKVRIVKNVDNPHYNKYIGAEFEVLGTDVCLNSEKYLLDCPSNFGGSCTTWRESELELVKPLPQPQKSLLKSGDKVVYRGGSKRYVLMGTETLHDVKDGDLMNHLGSYMENLISKSGYKLEDIIQVYRNDELIMQRTEKSEKELRKETIEAEMAKLQKELDELK